MSCVATSPCCVCAYLHVFTLTALKYLHVKQHRISCTRITLFAEGSDCPYLTNYPKVGDLNSTMLFHTVILCIGNEGRAQLGDSPAPGDIDWITRCYLASAGLIWRVHSNFTNTWHLGRDGGKAGVQEPLSLCKHEASPHSLSSKVARLPK